MIIYERTTSIEEYIAFRGDWKKSLELLRKLLNSTILEETRLQRLGKAIPMILEGIGLNDKYMRKKS